ELFLYRKAWKIAAATEGIRDYMIEQGKAPEDVFLLPNGVNTDVFRPLPKNKKLLAELGLEGKVVFTYAGTMGYAQG
ncbi:glycosyltransferase WbuB, partial [Anoxybacillus sp. LAT_11]|nr:glycosyltransferase WbuB [Anoxybacillus sp. LAT_11]